MMNDHEPYMRRAIELAANVPLFPFGAVIVDRTTGEIVAEGWNKTSVNPTWHGEIDAINRLAEHGAKINGRQLVLYTTAEPCPMCTGAILWSGIETVVYGTSIRHLQSLGWRQIDILADEVVRRSPTWKCDVIGGILEDDCNALFQAAKPSHVVATRTLFDFTDAEGWHNVNDDVMGGISEGRCNISDRQTLEFFGNISLENKGGFASVRTVAQELGLALGDTLIVKVRGDGREYSLNLYLKKSKVAFAYRATLPTTKEDWLELKLPLASFEANSFGKPVRGAGPVDPTEINALGFLLSDKQAGPFKLDVAWIRVERS
jgi:tRNA(adenine34) deaminase